METWEYEIIGTWGYGDMTMTQIKTFGSSDIIEWKKFQLWLYLKIKIYTHLKQWGRALNNGKVEVEIEDRGDSTTTTKDIIQGLP